MLRRFAVVMCIAALVACAQAQAPENRVSLSEKGSVLIFPFVEIAWIGDGQPQVARDTIITLTNDFEDDVDITMYYVDYTCQFKDIHFSLTRNQPAYWSVLTGLRGPDGARVPGFANFGAPPRPYPFPYPALVKDGFVVVIATNASNGLPIRWNKLMGEATIVDYAINTAFEYKAYAFAAHGVTDGDPIGSQTKITFDQNLSPGYASAFHTLLLDFYRPGTTPFNSIGVNYPSTAGVFDTDLVLIMLDMDFRRDPVGPWNTLVVHEIYDENENGQTGLAYCQGCYARFTLATLGGYYNGLPTTAGYARIVSEENSDCEYWEQPWQGQPPELITDDIETALLGVAYELVGFSKATFATDGGALRGSGAQEPPDYTAPMIQWLGTSGGDDLPVQIDPVGRTALPTAAAR